MRVFERTTDPLTGLRTTIGAQDGRLVVKTEQDVAPSMDHALALRNSQEYSAAGIKGNFWHCVHIPEVVALQMITEDGFNVYTQPAREVRKFLAKHKDKYGRLFTTTGAF
jgi:hypothetical protein